jgi:non-homologous end joining protein Ku
MNVGPSTRRRAPRVHGRYGAGEFEDRYETAVREVIDRKAKGEKIEAKRPERPSNVLRAT